MRLRTVPCDGPADGDLSSAVGGAVAAGAPAGVGGAVAAMDAEKEATASSRAAAFSIQKPRCEIALDVRAGAPRELLGARRRRRCREASRR